VIWCLYRLAMHTKRIAVYVANSTRLPYLHVTGTSISMDWFYSRSASTSVTTCAIGSVISHRPQRVLPCLIVTLSNITSLLIYPATFVSSMLYRYTTCWIISSDNLISRNRTRAQISTVLVGGSCKHSADLQIDVPSSALLFITRSFVAIQYTI